MIELKFNKRPVDVPPDLRLYRRLGILIVSISECCRGATASLRQLHFLNSLYMDSKFCNLYLEFKSENNSLKILSPSADPYLNRCIDYAIGADLLDQKKVKNGFRLILTESGKRFFEEIKKENLLEDIFSISKVLGKITEKEIQSALRV